SSTGCLSLDRSGGAARGRAGGRSKPWTKPPPLGGAAAARRRLLRIPADDRGVERPSAEPVARRWTRGTPSGPSVGCVSAGREGFFSECCRAVGVTSVVVLIGSTSRSLLRSLELHALVDQREPATRQHEGRQRCRHRFFIGFIEFIEPHEHPLTV